jgi:hypothetical protein
MGLTEVPSELFRMKSVFELWLNGNKLCSLPSELAHLTTLELFYVKGVVLPADSIERMLI